MSKRIAFVFAQIMTAIIGLVLFEPLYLIVRDRWELTPRGVIAVMLISSLLTLDVVASFYLAVLRKRD